MRGKSRARKLPCQIGVAIEEIHKDKLWEYYEILSEHFSKGGDFSNAAGYAKRAAKKAEKGAFLTDAITQARKRVLYLEKLPESGDGGRERIDARTVLGLYLNQLSHWGAAKDAVEPVARLVRDMGYRKRLGQIQTIMGAYYGFIDENFLKAFEALDEALRIAADEKDFITLVMASLWTGVFHAYDCEFEKVMVSLQRAIDINTVAKSLWGIASMKAQYAFFGYIYAGKIKALTELSSEALKIAQESGDPISLGMSHTTYGWACYARGFLEEAENHTRQGKDLCERIGFTGWAGNAWIGLAEIYFEMKAYTKARECYAQAIRISEIEQSTPSWRRWEQLGVARCDVMLGEKDVDLESLRTGYERNRYKLTEGWTCRYIGEILLNIGGLHIAEAQRWMKKAIEADAGNGMRFHLGMDHALYGEFLKRQGHRDRAQEEFGKATEVLQECGADGWVEKYQKELDLLA